MRNIVCKRLLQFNSSIKKPAVAFSTAQPEPGEPKSIALKTLESNPGNHNIADHGGLYYTLPPETKQQLFQFGGFPKPFLKQCQTFTESCIMVRKPALEIIQFLKTADYNNPIQKYVVYGKLGAGKSISLTHVLHYALLNDWLIVHVPWVGDWLRRTRYEVVTSATRPGFVELPAKAVGWLLHFKSQNSDIINKFGLKIENDYEWNKRETTNSGASLLELVDHGINRPKYASEVVVALLSEIKSLSKKGAVKTLVAIDGYSAFFHPHTRIKNEDRVMMPPDKITFITGFLDITKADWHNGAAILICDEMATPGHNASPLPLYQLTKKGFEYLDPFIPICVPEMTEKEIYSMLAYYKDRMWLQNTQGDKELAYLSGGNPWKLMQLCGPL